MYNFVLLLIVNPWLIASAVANEPVRVIEPVFVNSISNSKNQHNDTQPNWSADGELVSFERSDTSQREIILSNTQGNSLKTIAIHTETESLDDLFGESSDKISFNYGISWAPNNKDFVFTSNGEQDNFDLYRGNINNTHYQRLTNHSGKDSHASWSNDGRFIAFISSRDGRPQLYRLDTKSLEIIKLTTRDKNTFYPVWSPDSKQLAFIQETEGIYQVFVIDNIDKPASSLRQLTNLSNISVRPSWSSDGKKIAFFHLSSSNDVAVQWDIIALNSQITKPVNDIILKEYRLADNVVLNSNTGPTWIPNTEYLAYVDNKNKNINPIQLVNLNTHQHLLLNTHTILNKDLSCSKDGVLAFQSQDMQWSRIFISKLPELKG